MLISPIEMMGMFGVAQVVGAKAYGVDLVTPDPAPWSPPWIVLQRTDEELMAKWSLNTAPQWAEVPLAVKYQAQKPPDLHKPKRRKKEHQLGGSS